MRLLVTRPQPGAAATAARLQAAGHDAVVMALLAIEPIAWSRPVMLPDAIMLTSAAAARLAGPHPDLLALPCHVLGSATAEAARTAGFCDVRAGGGTVQQVIDTLAGSILHLAGEDRTAVKVPTPVTLIVVNVYRARLLPLASAPAVDGVLLYSARAARHFAAESDRLGGDRHRVTLFALSPAVAAAAGRGWQRVVTAKAPDEQAMLAAIAAAWQ